jgi:hypothetical protein
MQLMSHYIALLYFKAELKTLQEIASPSFEFAKDLMKHNLVSIVLRDVAIHSQNRYKNVAI